MQQLTIAGNVGRDAELRQTQGGDSVLNFSLAVDNGKDKNGNKRDASWFDCALWGKRADALQSYITKGSKLVVTGRPTAREHNGKVYMGCNVQELTFMGGGQSSGSDNGGQSSGGYGGGYAGPSAGGADPFDGGDSIPFAPW